MYLLIVNISIFDYLDYVEFIKDACDNLCITYKALSTSTRIHTSYFSRVMQRKADFSIDQVFLIGSILKLGEDEIEYFLLIHEYESSSLNEHKAFVHKKIKKIRNEKLKLLNKLTEETNELSKEDISIYYQSSITAKIHMYLTIDKFRLSPNLIAKKLFISDARLGQELNKLKTLNLIVYENDIIVLKSKSVHLDEANPNSVQNHINWRLESINHLGQRNSNPSDYHLSAVFSCDEESKIKIKDEFKKFIVKVQNTVQSSKQVDDVYYIGLDLY